MNFYYIYKAGFKRNCGPKYRKNVHATHNLHFDNQTFNEWKKTNAYIFDLQKSNIAFSVFYENIQNI